jgi:hypothetical protein
VRSSLTGTFGGSLRNAAANRSYPFTYTISAANTFEFKTITVAGDTTGTWATDNTEGINVFFGLGVGSTLSGTAGAWAGSNFLSATGATSVVGTNGATFYITGVQLEAGTVASPFERRDYGRELIMCQRYFCYAGGSAGRAMSATVSNQMQLLSPQMRATPTVAIKNGTSAIVELGVAYRNITGVTLAGSENNGTAVGVETSGSTGMTSGNAVSIPGNNGISFSAEL